MTITSSFEGSYALWLMPPPKQLEMYQQTVQGLAKKYGTSVFEPHLTLASQIHKGESEARSLAQRLVNFVHPIDVQITEISDTPQFYRCIIAIAKLTQPLSAIESEARKIFELPEKEKFLPHLSLLYGDLSADVRQDIVSELDPRLICTFQVSTISLVWIDKDIRRWKRLEDFQIQRQPI